MPVVGITGGVATGKSTFTGELALELGAEVFDSDRCAHELLANDRGVHAKIQEIFGSNVFDPNGSVSRAGLRERVFREPELRRNLEQILHPPIRDRWLGRAAAARDTGSWLLVDIPLLFETATESAFDTTVVVAAGHATQVQRLMSRRALDREMAGRMVDAQLPMQVKLERARHVVWNGGSMQTLKTQARLFAGLLKTLYG